MERTVVHRIEAVEAGVICNDASLKLLLVLAAGSVPDFDVRRCLNSLERNVERSSNDDGVESTQ